MRGIGTLLSLLLASSALAQGEIPWTQIKDHPSACASNTCLTAIADALTCTSYAHDILDASIHSDSAADAVTKGSLIVGNSTPKWDELGVGSDGDHLVADSSQTLGVKWESVADTIGGFTVLSWANTTDPGGAVGAVSSAAWLDIPTTGYWYQGSFAQYSASLSHQLCIEAWVSGCTGNQFTIRLRDKTNSNTLASFNSTLTASGTTTCTGSFSWAAPATDAKIWIQAACTVSGGGTLSATLASWVFK